MNGEDISILICDDDPETRRVIRHSLRQFGYRLEEAADGVEAKEKCLSAVPHLLITDVMMPNMTGIELVQWVRSELPLNGRYLPILMITALDDIEHKIAGLEVGADEYIPKPFHYRELQARVQGLIRIKALTEELLRRNDEQIQLNRKLHRMQQELIRREKEVLAAQLVGTAAHNLGQPVTAILLNCHMAERFLANAGQDGHDSGLVKALRAIRQDGERLKELLQQLVKVDPEKRENYVSGVDILRLEPDAGGPAAELLDREKK